MSSALERLRKARQGSGTSLASVNISTGTAGNGASGGSALARLRAARAGSVDSGKLQVESGGAGNTGASGGSALARLRAARAAQAQTQLTPAARLYASEEEKNKQEEHDNGGWLGGVGYVAEKAGLGFLQTFEGAVDYVSAAITSIFDEEAAKDILENDWVNYSHADEWFNPSEAWRVAGDVAGGIGTSLAGVGVGLAVSAIPGGAAVAPGLALGVMGLGAAGTSTKEAYMESGKLGLEEFAYGGAMGLVEAGTEWLSGGFGAGVTKAIGAFTKSAGKTATALTLKSFAKDMGKEFLSEAFEEGFSEWISPYAKKVTYDPKAKNATAEEILYAGFVGGLSGLVMGGGRVGVTQIMNRADGSTAVREGRVSSIMDTAKAFSDYEGAHPTKLSSMEAVRDLYTRLEAQGVREAAKLTGEQRRALGELQTLTTSAVFESPMQKSALSAVAGAEAIAEKLNADGNIKMVDGKMQSVTPESIAELQKKGAEVRDITAEDIRGGVDAKNGKSVAKAMQKNDLLRYIVASDVAGRFMMTANEVEAAARAGTKIKSQADLNAFIENASDERKSALGAELGIADSEWATLKLKRFNEAAAAYRESGKLEQRRAEMKAAEQNKNAYAGEAVGGENADISALTSTEQGNVSVSGGKSVRYSFVGRTEDGRGIYKSNYPENTPKTEKQNDIINLVQNVWSKKPIKLNISVNGENVSIEAKFNPELTERSDLSKIAFGNRKGTASEKRITMNLSSDLYQIAEDSHYVGSKTETGKDNAAHSGVSQWHYFVTDLVYIEEDGTSIDCYMNIDVKQNDSGNWFYSFAIEKGSRPADVLSVVTEKSATTSTTIIPDSAKKSNSFEENSQENAENSADFGKNAASAESSSEKSGANTESSSEKSSKEKIAELKERIDKKKIDAYCRENIEEYASMSAANQSMIRQVVREGRVYGLDDADILSYARVAARSGLNIVYDENLDAKGNAGAYDPENNRIVVNPKAEKRQELILIHELDHTIRAYLGDDGKIHYITYKDADKKVSKEKWEQIKKDYADQDIEVTREELFADEASAYYTEELIGTDKFIDLLLGKEPSLAKKILNFFTGAARAYSKDAKLSKEARRHYKNFKKMFDAFSEFNKGRNAETAVESVGDGKAIRKTLPDGLADVDPASVTELEVRELLRRAKRKTYNDGTYIPVRVNTPRILIESAKEVGESIENRPFFMSVEKVRQAMSSPLEWAKEGNVRTRAHDLSENDMISIIQAMDKPKYIIYQPDGRFVEIVEIKTTGNGKVVAVVEASHNIKKGYLNGYKGGSYQVLVTAFPPDSGVVEGMLKNKENVVVYPKKKGSSQRGSGNTVPSHLNDSPFATSITDSAEKSNSFSEKSAENSDKISKSARKSGDFEAKLEDAEDSDKVTISKGQAQKLAANYNSDRVYDKKDVVKALRGIDGFANLPEDMQKELLRDVWVGLNSRYGKGARETFVEVMSNKIPYMLLTESYTEENAKEYGRLQSAKKRAKKTLEGEALEEKLEAIDRELEKLENVPDRLFDTYEQSRIDEINREIAEALNKLLDGGKPSLRSKIEGEFDASDAGKWKKKYIEAEFNETSAEKWKTKYYEARGRAKKLLNLSYQVQKMRDLKLGTFLNATDYKNEIFRETFDILGSINFRGNISPKTVRRAMARLAEWYAPDNPVLAEIDGQPGTRLFSDYIAIEINNIASGEGELSMHELDMLDNILRHATNIVENFNRVWKDGKWVEADKTAKAMIEVADETNILRRSGDMRRLGKRLGRWFKKYTTTFADPMTLFRYMDGYGNGFWTQMGEELRQAAFRHGVDLMEMKADYDAFNNGHKKYVKNASREVVEYGGAKMTKLQFMSLYMTMHRDQAARGLAENGFSFIDTDGNRVEVEGFLERMQDKVAGELGLERAEDGRWKVSDEQMKSLRESEISEMKKLLSDEDLKYIGIIEKTLNGRCKELKTSRDMERLGFSNTISGYYYPIVRAMIAQNIDKRGMWGELDRASNISANKNTVKGAAGALWIESCDTVFNRHIDAVARYAELSPVIDTINKLFNLDVSGNKNKPRSIRTATFNSWQTGAALGAAQSDAQKHNGEAYLKELLSDVQGIGRERSVGNQLVENLRGGFAISALAGNPKVLMTQLSSVFASMNILSKSSLMMGIGRGFGKDVGTELDKYCPVAKLRNYDSAAAKAQGVLDEVRGVGEFLMKPIGFMDRQVVKMLWGAAQVEAEKTTKHKIGTEENKVEAGKILERVIFETQQNSVATEKSAAMRSTNMLMRSLTMFTSDAMKGVGRVIDAFGEVSALKARIRQSKASGDTAKVKTLEEKLKGASAQARRSVGALAMTALYMTLIARAFSWLYKKEEDEEDKTPLAFVADVFGGMLGGLPIISDVYDFFVSGYDLSDNVYDTMNGVLQGVSKVTNTAGKLIAGEATAADMNGATISAMQSIGTVLGLPIRNVRNMVMGLTRRFNPNAAYRLEMLSEAKNFASDFEEAINAGDEEKAAMILELLLREAVESGELKVENGDSGVSEALRGEILRMKTAGYNILPRTIGSTVTIAGEEIEMSAEEQTALRARYSEAIPSIESLVGSSAYASLSDEQKESAVRFVYDVYYDAGIYELYGYERNMKRRIFSKIIAPEKLALANAVTAGLESDYEDERGRTISLEKWATVKGTTARVNYSTVSGSKRKKVIAAINKLPLTTAEKLLIIAYKGYTIKDGDIRGVSAARAKQMLSRYARGQGLSADEAKALEGYL